MSLPRDRGSARDPLARAPLRLTYRAMRALTVIGGDPGLDDCQIGERTGIKDTEQISKLLRRLSLQGLIENAGGGRADGAGEAWCLTPDGLRLERRLEASISTIAACRA